MGAAADALERPPGWHTPGALRLHGAGDGSVMAYCGSCREPLPHLPRPATLAAVQEAWNRHVEQTADAAVSAALGEVR